MPKYGSINPAKARIRVFFDELEDLYVPVRSSQYADAECIGRHIYIINGKEYQECSFCEVSCPSRKFFKEPDSGLPLKCDTCEQEPPLSEPVCVQVCLPGTLTYEERKEEGEEKEKPGEMEIGLETLVKKHGLKAIEDTLARISKG